MKKVFLIVGLLVLMSMLAGSAIAADLQAGWYARIRAVDISDYDWLGNPYVRAVGWFSIEPGGYGPFQVTDGYYHNQYERAVNVQADAFGIGPEASINIPVWFGMVIGEPVGWIDIVWETNYDSSQMRLEFWRTRSDGNEERVWTQQMSGVAYGSISVLNNTSYEGDMFFRIQVVPEPGSFVVVAAGCLGIIYETLRRRRIP